MDNFYKDLPLNTIEIAEASEDFYTTDGSAKFYIPSLMPFISNTIEMRPYSSAKNIVNKVDVVLGPINTFTGHIVIPLHIERLGEWPEDKIPKGSQFMVVFVGGDITKPRILGRY
ncbi:MAG: hypothetical protein M0P49_05480 [Bacilli bacterium]|nr:hypothetical protein [Bacilli bacterium]